MKLKIILAVLFGILVLACSSAETVPSTVTPVAKSQPAIAPQPTTAPTAVPTTPPIVAPTASPTAVPTDTPVPTAAPTATAMPPVSYGWVEVEHPSVVQGISAGIMFDSTVTEEKAEELAHWTYEFRATAGVPNTHPKFFRSEANSFVIHQFTVNNLPRLTSEIQADLYKETCRQSREIFKGLPTINILHSGPTEYSAESLRDYVLSHAEEPPWAVSSCGGTTGQKEKAHFVPTPTVIPTPRPTLSPDVAPINFSHHNAARKHFDQGEYDKAIDEFTKAIELNPNDALAYNNRGFVYHHRLNIEYYHVSRSFGLILPGEVHPSTHAINDYSKAIELDPNFIEAVYNRDILFDTMNHVDNPVERGYNTMQPEGLLAQIHTLRGLKFHGHPPAYDLNLADFSQGDYDRAIDAFTKAIELDPDYATNYINRGYSWARKGQYSTAIEDFDRAVGLSPNFASNYRYNIYAYSALDHHQWAIEDFDDWIVVKPSFVEAYYSRGLGYLEKGLGDKAAAEFDKACSYWDKIEERANAPSTRKLMSKLCN